MIVTTLSSRLFWLQSARSVWRQRLGARAKAVAITSLQSARSVWRQSSTKAFISLLFTVAICTERVEAKSVWAFASPCTSVLQSARSVWRQRWLEKKISAKKTLQSARSVWRQSEKVAGARREITRCNLHGACRETERHHPSEKNPRKFMQTYCIFIHLGV